ncbi:MAG TPA: DUF1150 domain-containing protein [Methyloceanibacter sp.]|jgi:hypothetical protein|nr:DUF1150 domain-containing protein [Methyloceanibacter sp.]
MNKFEEEEESRQMQISRRELAQLGDGEVAYIKQLDSDAAERLFPALSDAPKGIDLFAVLGADGTPLALTDSRSAAIANAIENNLVPVSVH